MSDEIKRQASTIHVGKPPKSLSFSGCGFLGVYHIGVASCFRQHAPTLLNNMDRIYGCSAGSIIGAMLLNDICFGEVCRSTLEIVKDARSRYLGPLSPGFKLNELLMKGFRKGLPPDAHKRATGKLFISLTRLRDGKNVIVSEYKSRQELMDVLICSSFVPFYSGLLPPTYRGTYYVDGGISNNLPAHEDTITVSPWSGESDICPRNDSAGSVIDINIANTSIQISTSNLHRCSTMFFPSKAEVLHDFCRQGFRDTVQYLRDHGLFETISPIPRSLSFSCDLNHFRRERRLSTALPTLQSTIVETEYEKCSTIKENLTENETFHDESYTQGLVFEYVKSNDVLDIYADSVLSDDASSETSDYKSEISNEDQNYGQWELSNKTVTVVQLQPNYESSIVLQFHLPAPVVEALESFYSNYRDPTWRRPVGKLLSLCRQKTLVVTIPLDRAYQITCILINQINYFPTNIRYLLEFCDSLIQQLCAKLSMKKSDLFKFFQKNVNNYNFEDLTWKLNIILQITVAYLVRNQADNIIAMIPFI